MMTQTSRCNLSTRAALLLVVAASIGLFPGANAGAQPRQTYRPIRTVGPPPTAGSPNVSRPAAVPSQPDRRFGRDRFPYSGPAVPSQPFGTVGPSAQHRPTLNPNRTPLSPPRRTGSPQGSSLKANPRPTGVSRPAGGGQIGGWIFSGGQPTYPFPTGVGRQSGFQTSVPQSANETIDFEGLEVFADGSYYDHDEGTCNPPED